MKYIGLLSKIFLCLAMTAVSINAQSRSMGNKYVEINTDLGSFVVVLYDDTPIHRDNFLKLVKDGYYDGLLFHRVIADFMVQGGDPDSRDAKPKQILGEGGPGYTLSAEITNQHYHHKGVLAAAREGDDVNPERRSSGSQFYIVWGKPYSKRMLSPIRQYVAEATGGEFVIDNDMADDYSIRGGSPHLDGQYTVFGEVVEGLKVIGKMEKVKNDRNDRPLKDIRIISARVLDNYK